MTTGPLRHKPMTREEYLSWLATCPKVAELYAQVGYKPRVRVPAGSVTTAAPKYER